MKEKGFAPIIALLVVAAVALIAVGVVKNHPSSSSLPQFFSQITQPAVKSITQSITYSTQGAAKSTTILVKFKSSVSDQTVSHIHQTLGTKVKKTIKGINAQVVEIPSGGHVEDFVKEFKGRSEVAYAEPNFLAHSFFIPNDPDFGSEWNLQKINAPTAWDSSQGGFGPIAVIDTGVDANHPDLSGEVTGGYNFIDGSTNTADDNGHGTHVAGIIDAITDNGTGIASIGYKGTIMPVKVLDSTGVGTDGDIASGITYAVDNGAKIINLSLGGPDFSQTEQDAINYATSKGVMVVAAAGNNSNSSPVYPAADQGVLAVSASDQNDNLASFSSFGSDIFVSAPGVSITSTYNNGGYAQMSGTSMAAPALSGLLGLAFSSKGSSGKNIIQVVEQTADKIGPYPYDQNGWNQYFGYGRIDAGKLLTYLNGSSPTPAPTQTSSPQETPQTGASAPHATKVFSFNVELEGSIDSVDVPDSKIVVKINGISQNVGVYSGNLVDLFVYNQANFLSSLQAGEKINAKALWQNNMLIASEVTVQGNPAQQSANNRPGNQNSAVSSNQGNSGAGTAVQNVTQDLPGNSAQGRSHSGKPF